MNELSALTDPEAERLVIGSLCIDAGYLPSVRAILAAEDFSDQRCRHFYRAMLVLDDRGVPADDAMCLYWELQALGFMEDAKPSHIAWCASLPLTPCHAVHYALRVKDLADRRRMFTEAQRMAGAALDRSVPVAGRGKPGGIQI